CDWPFSFLLVGDCERIKQGARRISASILFCFPLHRSGKPHSSWAKRPERHPSSSSNPYHAANAEPTDTIACSRGGIGRAPSSEVSKARDRSGPRYAGSTR